MQNDSVTHVQSPLGTIQVIGIERGVRSIQFVDDTEEDNPHLHISMQQCTEQLGEYFEKRRTSFHTFDIAVQGTEFQQRVWEAAMEVPFGETVTYADIAKAIGNPDASRAVGTALGANPLLLIVPCHRIVPSSGAIGGFAAGGWRKKWLLEHEQKEEKDN